MHERGRCWLVALAWVGLAGIAGAQGPGGTVSGYVVRASGSAAIEAAQVGVEGRAGVGAVTDARGRFVITGLTGDSVTLIVRRLGFSSARQTFAVGAHDVQIGLNETAVKLDEIVTTGTPGAVEQRSLGNAVSTIDAVQELQQSGAPDLGDLIQGRAAAVNVLPGTGVVGAGPAIEIRGVNTISLHSQPLLYIDGVRVANDAGTGPQTQGGQVTSRLNDIDPEEIESIQIIKGPAAATIYGTAASNGVIQVITKKGAAGKPVFDIQTRQGSQWFPDQAGRLPTNYFINPATSKLDSWNGAAIADASGTPVFRTGDNLGLSASVAGGTQQVTYRLGANYDYGNGVDRTNAARNLQATSNVLYHATPALDFGSTLYIIHDHSSLGQQNGLSPMFSTLFGSSAFFPASGGYYQAPLSAENSGVFANTQDLNGFTGTATVTNRPTSWFSHRLIIGYDQRNETNQGLTNFMPASVAQFFTPTAAEGSNLIQNRNEQTTTLDYAGTFSVPIVAAIKSNTSLGAQWYSNHLDSTDVNASEFPGPGVSAVSAAAVIRTDGDFVTNNTLGFYAQQQFNWRDRLFITGAVRVDNNSAFGSNFQWVTYPKVEGSWVVSDESFWQGFQAVDKLQLRAAYGESGNQPLNFAALRTYASAPGPGGSVIATPFAPGNSNLQPERGKEIEVGFTASILTRIGIDFTYYSRNTINEILSENLPPSKGFPGIEYFNAGKVYSHGLELQATAQVLRGNGPVALDLFANASTDANEITNFGGFPPQNPAATLPITFDEQGLPLNSYFSHKVVSASLNSSGVATNLMCDGGPSAGHAPVPCASAPLVDIGQAVPKFVGSGGVNLTLFKRLRIHAQVDARTGWQFFDADDYLRCIDFGYCLATYKPQNYSPIYVASLQNDRGSLTYIQPWVQNADFAKLRELSGTFTLPDAWARGVAASHISVTIGGRNLHTWTSYKGLDPETRTDITDNFVPYTQAIIPLPSQFFTTVNLTF
ncbi:MAG TPA: TonB-dependent receptor [Gemmatimonadaceae bacterium]|jgi:TonB-linked SusC/RagA family outer membrane protein|nr:TonB-dependent receptor [Gemmatimonadaceae bacterium]